ncbi:MAG TPA: ATP-binding protein [Beijerinckiaceae bacterium]|jgi:two-component system phosphate regulon sensor histidine kinase PhoR
MTLFGWSALRSALLGRGRRAPDADPAASPKTGRTASEALLDAIPDPVVVVDGKAVVRQANDAATALLPALEAGEPLSFALRSPDVLDGIAAVAESGAPARVEYAEQGSRERTFEVRIGPLETGREGDGGVLLLFRDLTDARRLERLRVDFIANASHELRTPLASLLGFIETLQGPARDDPAARERFLGIMHGQARRMARLIDDLLSLSRIELKEHLRPDAPLDLGAVVRPMLDVLAPRARERGVEIALAVEDGPHIVLGEPDELSRVVENLVDNAVKYGESGKRVEVTLRRATATDGHLTEIELSVRDYGPGIAREHLPRLTERFYRADVAASRQKGGTGLGLAIVKHIVARHGGRLVIESESGQGATFRVLLPEAPPERRGA